MLKPSTLSSETISKKLNILVKLSKIANQILYVPQTDQYYGHAFNALFNRCCCYITQIYEKSDAVTKKLIYLSLEQMMAHYSQIFAGFFSNKLLSLYETMNEQAENLHIETPN